MQMNKSEEIDALATALSKAQAAFGPALKDANNPFYKSRYADLRSVWEAAVGPLTAHGLSVAQVGDLAGDPFVFDRQGETQLYAGVIVETILMHESGQWISGKTFYPLKNLDAQGVGSVITYGRRYGLMAILGITPDDDDGNAGSNRGNESQYKSSANKPTSAPPPTAPVAPAVDYLGTGEAKKHEAKLKELCTGLNRASDLYTDDNNNTYNWTGETLNLYAQAELDAELKSLDKASVLVLISDLTDRLEERLAIAAEGMPSHTGIDKATEAQVNGMIKMCEIKGLEAGVIALEFSENATDDLAELTEEQAASALKALPKR